MPFIPHTDDDIQSMLKTIGVKSIEDLFADIPPAMRPKSFALPKGLSEQAATARLEELSARNDLGVLSFAGAGVYDHAIPKAVDALTSRGEFLTAYTPYQPEAAQGTLQAIFEYQTAVCRLFDMDVSNASLYDGGSAIFEAAMMAVRAKKGWHLVVDEGVSPLYRQILDTLTANLPVRITTVPHMNGQPDFSALESALEAETSAVIVQNPNFFGVAADYGPLFAKAREKDVCGIISVNPVMASVLKTPGEMGADIAVAEGQSLGLPMSFGGPYLGMIACTKDMVRQIPGRIVGRTEDLDGKTGYVLTLQAREQHIRRAKATSNICSNQALCALRTLVHLCLLGPEGLTRTAELSMERAREAAKALCALPGVELYGDAPFGYEFAIKLPKPAAEVVEKLAAKGVIPGIPLGAWYPGLENVLLVACTEKTCKKSIEKLTAELGGVI